jgi:hypothetical protein
VTDSAESRLEAVAKLVAAAYAERNRVIVETADEISRRRAGKILDLSPSAVQIIVRDARQASGADSQGRSVRSPGDKAEDTASG